MPISKGKDVILRISDGAGDFDTIGGMRAKTFSLSAGLADASHTESNGWRELIPGGGLRQVSVSGSGVFLGDQGLDRARQQFFGQILEAWQLVVPSYGTLTGPFQLTNLDYAGEFRGEATFSIALASAGEIVFDAAGAGS